MSTEALSIRAGKPFAVLEIGNDRLKMMRAVPSAGGGVVVDDIRVEKIASATLDAGEVIGRILGEWPAGPYPAILCLPRQLAIVRHLELPSGDPGEIADMVAIQAAKLTPWSREEVAFDFRVVGASERQGYTGVMLVIAQRGVFRQRYFIAEEAGLVPVRATISSEGLLPWVGRALTAGDDLPAAVLDVDSFYSDFHIVKGTNPLFSRAILLGAERLRDGGDKARDDLAREVAQSLEMAARETPGTSPTRIVVTGAAAVDDGLIAALRAQTGLACEKIDVLDGLTAPGGKHGLVLKASVGGDQDAVGTASLTALLGLAASPERLEIDLSPESARLRAELTRNAGRYAFFTAAALALLASASLTAHTFYMRGRENLRILRAAVEAGADDVANVTRRHELVLLAESYVDARQSPLRLLADIQARRPPDVALESLEWDAARERLTVSGTASGISDVRELLSAVAAIPGFGDVREDGSMSRDTRTGRFRFKIAATLAGGSMP